jgi:N-acetyl-D-muramate 6-phosphate phosphatase
MPTVAAVLFDLDGTLVDSAPDLAGTLNDMRAARGLAPWPVAALRNHCGSGARGMLGEGLQIGPSDPGYLPLRDEFLDLYQARMLRHTTVFEPVLPMLRALRQRALPWGIVTNKAMRFAQPLCAALALHADAGALVGGDSTPYTKPHPAPLLEAARQLQCAPQSCVYLGDDPRDITAGRAAGMRTLVAAWGYTGAAPPVHTWGADAVLKSPKELLQWLDLP